MPQCFAQIKPILNVVFTTSMVVSGRVGGTVRQGSALTSLPACPEVNHVTLIQRGPNFHTLTHCHHAESPHRPCQSPVARERL